MLYVVAIDFMNARMYTAHVAKGANAAIAQASGLVRLYPPPDNAFHLCIPDLTISIRDAHRFNEYAAVMAACNRLNANLEAWHVKARAKPVAYDIGNGLTEPCTGKDRYAFSPETFEG